MELIDGLKQGTAAGNGLVDDPDHIVSMEVAADAE
jgi:hypothetical protein